MVSSLISGVENKPMHFTDMLIPNCRKQMATDGMNHFWATSVCIS